ncbi:MAG: cysteine desulfurase [Candidatus Hecatellales archaeon]|nr:MAG: cysteine desulfurase [Candidatus Hecatellales archaeon]
MLNVGKVRRDFPLLKKGVIYFDSAASSLTPKPVVDRMLEYYLEYRSNIERGLYELSQYASEQYETARRKVASFLGAKPEEIIFTKNTTEGINLVAQGLKLRRGDRIVTTLLEHHSNFLPWLRCKQKFKVEIRFVKPDVRGILDPADFEKAVNNRTKIVAVTHVSNVLGTISPVREIVEIAKERGSLVLVDGAQAAPHMEVDVKKLGCDFYAVSAHKMCGPTGVGALYVKEEHLGRLDPLCLGGGTVEYVGRQSFRLRRGPERFEAGTPPIGEVIGFKAAIEYLENLGMGNVETHERKLSKMLYEGLREIPKVEVYSPEPENKLGVTSFNIKGLDPHKVALILDSTAKIAVRSGMHCAQPLVRDILKQPQGTVRASPYIYNTPEEVEKLLSTVETIAR